MKLAALLLTAVLVPTAAMADDIVGGASTRAWLTVTQKARTAGALEVLGDSDWYRVWLTAGRTYAVNADTFSGGGGTTLALRRGAGVLASTLLIGEQASGFEVRAPASAVYFIEVRQTATPGDGPWPEGGRPYHVRVSPDCAGSTLAGPVCPLALDAVRQASTAMPGDHDRYKIRLDGGAHYALYFAAFGQPHTLVIRDRLGGVLRTIEASTDDTFTPPATGVYTAEVFTTGADGSRYTLAFGRPDF